MRLRGALEPERGRIGSLIGDLGGHDLRDLADALAATRERADRPTVIFAYTVKGYRLPIAGQPLNHSAHLTGEQIDEVRRALRRTPAMSGRRSIPARPAAGCAPPPANGWAMAAGHPAARRSPSPPRPRHRPAPAPRRRRSAACWSSWPANRESASGW